MFPALYTADLHLTSRPLDSYRWDIFPWLTRQIEQRKIKRLLILGDITDAKDNHPSELVNKMVLKLRTLARLCPITILMGNHDYVDETVPYFNFLRHIEGVDFIDQVTSEEAGGKKLLFVPHTRRWLSTTRDINFKLYDRVYFHQAFIGCVGANGHQFAEGSPGVEVDRTKKGVKMFAGDIHVPQEVNRKLYHPITYCGSPYPIDFGDDFKPRVLLDDGSKVTSVERVTVKKMSVVIDDPADLKGDPGDMVKVSVALPRSEFVHWEAIRNKVAEVAKKQELILCGIKLLENKRSLKKGEAIADKADLTNVDAFKRFCKDQRITDSIREAGLTLLETVK